MAVLQSLFLFLTLWATVSSTPLLPTSVDTLSGPVSYFEDVGFVRIPRGTNVFWWSYVSPNSTRVIAQWPNKNHPLSLQNITRPLILWLPSGPGYSAAFGDYFQVGPKTIHNTDRRTTWLAQADLIFVDPISDIGFSHSTVPENYTLPHTTQNVTDDLIEWARVFFDQKTNLRHRNLFIYGQGYASKFAINFGNALRKATKNGIVKANLTGVILEAPFVSPVDSFLSLPQFLQSFGLIDNTEKNTLQSTINTCIQNATFTYPCGTRMQIKLNYLLYNQTLFDVFHAPQKLDVNHVSNGLYTIDELRAFQGLSNPRLFNLATALVVFLQNRMTKRWPGVVPKNVSFIAYNQAVFKAFEDDYVHSVVEEIDDLLGAGIRMAVINGQLDYQTNIISINAWLNKLTWTGMKTFHMARRQAFNVQDGFKIAGFTRRFCYLEVHSVLRAGETFAVDTPLAALHVLDEILDSDYSIHQKKAMGRCRNLRITRKAGQ